MGSIPVKPRITPPPTQRIATEQTVTVTKTSPWGTTAEKVEKQNVKVFVTEPAYVVVRTGRTINMGNYESARVDVEFHVPCYKEEMLSVYREAMEATKKLLSAEVDSVEEEVKGNLRREFT